MDTFKHNWLLLADAVKTVACFLSSNAVILTIFYEAHVCNLIEASLLQEVMSWTHVKVALNQSLLAP